ncbi:MAG: hypothetical protein R3C54_14170 [Parvularculaceae bacterium]
MNQTGFSIAAHARKTVRQTADHVNEIGWAVGADVDCLNADIGVRLSLFWQNQNMKVGKL